MKVSDLIAELQKQDTEALVWVDMDGDLNFSRQAAGAPKYLSLDTDGFEEEDEEDEYDDLDDEDDSLEDSLEDEEL